MTADKEEQLLSNLFHMKTSAETRVRREQSRGLKERREEIVHRLCDIYYVIVVLGTMFKVCVSHSA